MTCFRRELKRQRTKAKESRLKNRSQQLSPDRSANGFEELRRAFVLDQPCKKVTMLRPGNPLYFHAVAWRELFSHGPVTTVYKVKPVLSAKIMGPSLALKQAKLKSGKDSVQFKKQLQALESELEQLKKLRHRNLLEVLDFRIDRESDMDAGVPSPVASDNLDRRDTCAPGAERSSGRAPRPGWAFDAFRKPARGPPISSTLWATCMSTA